MNKKLSRVWQREEGSATFAVYKLAEAPIYLIRLEGHLYDTSSPDCIDHEAAQGKACEFVKRQAPKGLVWDLTGALSAERQMRIDLKGYDTIFNLEDCRTIMVLGQNLDAETRAALQPKFRQQADTIEEALDLLMEPTETDLRAPTLAAAGVGNAGQSITVKGVLFQGEFKGKKILIGASLGRTLIGLTALIAAKGLWGIAGSFVAGAALVVLAQVLWHLLRK